MILAQDQDDGWEDVTDPREVQKFMGVKGVQQLQQRQQAGGRRADPTVTAPVGLTAAQQKAWEKANISQQTLRYLNDARDYYDRNFNATGLSAVKELYPWRDENGVFDMKVRALLGPAKGAYRVAGEGAFSDADIKLLTDSLPNRKWNLDSTNREAMARMDAILRGFIRSGYGAAGLPAPDIERAATSNRFVSPLQKRTLPVPPPRPAAPARGGWKVTKRR